ncbi:hypothetical protein IRZ71_09630 [Flavobacterium sp. ANB]|uniref:hypothetical protein n=1 Tax=unclassified Flavobacterium TaxID=196869 RepID=UPI0012B8A5A1|nr:MULTISPECIES: hypothetical protein [unclassified Flavobacterium]MBF4516606.1 hypothetical protein [Flavobacterium sp. ANB]MTD69497.1 hypothetical protein [Flavobacterium sp. LC2016-13]
MILIEKFYCVQTEIFGNGSEKMKEGIVSIKTELIRPSIKFLNSDGSIIFSEKRKTHRKKLLVNPFVDSNEYFSIHELLFLSKTYGFEIEEHAIHKGYFLSVLKINSLYNTPGEIILVEEEGKEYILIEFNRWNSENQPRGAGEDQLGEDITYIIGIWQDPLLTDAIIAKIKNKG